jgi:nitroreductase/dihydropteridine reductase
LKNRFTTKKFDVTKKIEINKIKALKEILRLSPSSINSQPWKFSFISDVETRQKLSQVSWLNTNKVLECDTVIVFSRIDCIPLFEKRIKAALPEGAYNY